MPRNMPRDCEFDVIRFEEPQDYRSVWDLQKSVNAEVAGGVRPDTLIFVEHKPVYTLGFHGDINNFHYSGSLSPTGADVELIRIERGGDITFHGPGQLVVYPIIDIARKNYGIRRYVELLEQAVIDVCAMYGIEAERVEDAHGVWCDTPDGKKKICAVGIKVKRGVTMHGIALNVTTDLRWFDMINPCGFQPGNTTSMSEMLGGVGVPSLDELASVLKGRMEALLKES